IFMACPNYYSTALNGNYYEAVKGPTTDKDGRFVNYRWVAFQLRGVRSSPCTIYANTGVNPFGPDIPATYLILPPDQPLDPCAAHSCPTVRTSPRRARTGTTETIQVSAWPGATADMQMVYGRAHPLRHRTHLDWRGQATWVTRVPTTLASATKVRITVRCRLG